MRKLFHLFPACLHIHDGGAAAPGGDGGAAAGQNNGGTQAPGPANQGKTGEAKPVVLYGKQTDDKGGKAPDAGGQENTQTPEQRKEAFKALISGEYKDEYTAEFQGAFDKRFKDYKATKEQLESLKPLADTLAEKYGISDGDAKKILSSVENDDTLWEDLAEEAGLSVEQFKTQRKIQRENEQLRSQQAQIDAVRQANEKKAEWLQQGEEMKATYPKFDLMAEIQNPKFVSLLKSGVDVKTAYQAAHFDEIVSGVVQTAGKRAEQATISSIQSKAQRPTEAGVSVAPGIIVKDDPSKYTKADRAEIARRAARGEQIRL